MNDLTNQDVIKLIKPLLKHDIWNVKESVTQVLGDIFKAMTAKDTLEQIASLLKDDDKNVRYSVMKILEYVLDVDQTFVNKDVLEHIKPLLKDDNWKVRDSTIEVLDKIVSIDPSLANKELLEHIIPALKDNDSDVRSSASKAFEKIIACDPSLANKELLEHIIVLLKLNYYDEKVLRFVIKALGKVLNINPSLNNQALDHIKPFLKDNDSDVTTLALKVLADIIVLDSSSATEVYNQIMLRERYDLGQWRLLKDVFRKIFKIEQSLAKEASKQIILILKFEDNHKVVRASAIDVLGSILQADPSLVNKELLEYMISLLKDEEKDLRASAINALGSILQSDPSLANKELLEHIKTLLKDEEKDEEDEDNNLRASANYLAGTINGIMILKGEGYE